MRPTTMILLVLLTAGKAAGGQQQYSPRAAIQRKNGSATVTANDPRPLWQAISALRKEYGWVVDYEEPLWRSTDLRDISSAAWHAAHPGRTGFLVPAGGPFQSSYGEEPDIWSSAGEEIQVLDKLVADYNTTENPGRFIVRAQSDGSYAVIGFVNGAVTGSSAGNTSILGLVSQKCNWRLTTFSSNKLRTAYLSRVLCGAPLVPVLLLAFRHPPKGWPVPVTGRRAKRGQKLRPFSAPTCNSMKVNAIDCDYTFGRGTRNGE